MTLVKLGKLHSKHLRSIFAPSALYSQFWHSLEYCWFLTACLWTHPAHLSFYSCVSWPSLSLVLSFSLAPSHSIQVNSANVPRNSGTSTFFFRALISSILSTFNAWKLYDAQYRETSLRTIFFAVASSMTQREKEIVARQIVLYPFQDQHFFSKSHYSFNVPRVKVSVLK